MKKVRKFGKFLLNAAVFYQALSSILISTVCFADADSSHWPLSTSGRWIVDAEGKRFKLKSVNWWGASDRLQVVGGLDHQPLSKIIQLIKQWGFNSVRLPFSNQMLHDSRPVQVGAVLANPEMIGKTPLEVYDQVIRVLTDAGIGVILNNHTTTSEWCCNYDYNGLWYHSSIYKEIYSQTTQMWISDWVMLSERYRGNRGVIGADLRNEVRTARLGDTYLPLSPQWGGGGDQDWHQAAQIAGNEILRVNPEILVIVEGINWSGIANFFDLVPDWLSGGRPVLSPVKGLPIHLNAPNKLVYSAHQYAFTGPKNTGDRRSSGSHPAYSELSQAKWKEVTEQEWGYLLNAQEEYKAPVWLSEFGAPPTGVSEQSQAWFERLVSYLIENNVDFAFWPLNGNDSWGLVSEDWSHILDQDWRFDRLRKLIDSP